jgi:hypothetical protein
VRENGLQPTKLEDVGDWWFADFMLRVEGVLDSIFFGYMFWIV